METELLDGVTRGLATDYSCRGHYSDHVWSRVEFSVTAYNPALTFIFFTPPLGFPRFPHPLHVSRLQRSCALIIVLRESDLDSMVPPN